MIGLLLILSMCNLILMFLGEKSQMKTMRFETTSWLL